MSFSGWHQAPTSSPPKLEHCARTWKTRCCSVSRASGKYKSSTRVGQAYPQQPLDQLIAEQQTVNALTILPIGLAHILGLHSLPPLHKDPFDRILVAQSIVPGATLLTADGKIPDYSTAILRVAPTS